MKLLKKLSPILVTKFTSSDPFPTWVEARTTTEAGLVLANMIVNAFTKEFSLVVKSETASQENVDDIANNILKAFEENLRS